MTIESPQTTKPSVPGLPRQSQAVTHVVAYGNPDKPGLGAVLAAIAEWSGRRGAGFSVSREILPALESAGRGSGKQAVVYEENHPSSGIFKADERALLVCLGGDGTLIHAVRRFWPFAVPVLGVNLGSLGFNASVEPEQTLEALDAWFEGRAEISERMMLRVLWRRAGAVLAESLAVNDAVLIKTGEARLIHLDLRQDELPIASLAADGLIVSTPTGSTAYNLSAGGPILHPDMKAIVVTAICPHTLAARPLVLPPAPPVSLEFVVRHKYDQALLWVDGQDRWALAGGDRIVIEAAAAPLRLIASGTANFFSSLRKKLQWSAKTQAGEE